MEKANIIKIDYWFDSYEKSFKQLAFLLFDKLGFKSNIVISFFRIINSSNLNEFQNKFSCKLVQNTEYTDRYCVFIPELQSNSILDRLMLNNYEFPTECTYTPLITDFNSFLLNQKKIEKYDAITYKLAVFESLLDHEGIHLKFDLEYFTQNKIDTILCDWESSINNIRYRKNKKTIRTKN